MVYLKFQLVRRLTVCFLALLSGCALTPRGYDDEQTKLFEAGKPYNSSFEERSLPELPPNPGWRDVLERGFLANGELEASYFEWKAALERVNGASAYPNSNLSFGYSSMFSKENMKSFSQSSFAFGTDPMENLALPIKALKAGEGALNQAREAGEKFRERKFALQRVGPTRWAETPQFAGHFSRVYFSVLIG